MKRQRRDMRFDFRFAQAWQLYERLPMKSVSILPDAGFPMVMVNVASDRMSAMLMPVMCDPKPSAGVRWRHRVKVWCDCQRLIPFGRMCQHAPTCEAFNAAHPRG